VSKTLQITVDVSLTLLPCRKDPQGIFAEPVTDDIAPGYSTLISNPMDFSTMSNKIETLQYQSIDEYKVNDIVMITVVLPNNVIENCVPKNPTSHQILSFIISFQNFVNQI